MKVSAKDRAIEEIKYLLLTQKLTPGEKLPPERELAEIIGVSRTALRSAIQELESAAIVESIQGSGTYICGKKIIQVFQESDSYSHMAQGLSLTPNSKLLSAQTIEANDTIASKLSMQKGDPVHAITRLRGIDDMPVSVETSYINGILTPGLLTFDFEQLSLYETLEMRYNIIITHARERISLSYATDVEAEHLKVTPGTALFFETSICSDDERTPIEYLRRAVLNTRYRFASVPKEDLVYDKVQKWLYI